MRFSFVRLLFNACVDAAFLSLRSRYQMASRLRVRGCCVLSTPLWMALSFAPARAWVLHFFTLG